MCKQNDEKGFTLMDVAIMMLIVGLIAVPFMQKLHAEDLKKKRDVTKSNLRAIELAVADYYFQWGYYPCPADLTRSPNDADYGREVRPGGNPGGVCVTAGAGVTEADGRDVDGAAPVERLLTGGVPFATLRLPVSAVLDGWSGKFTYSVSRPLTTGLINNDYGVITMWGFYRDPPAQNPPVFVEGRVTDRAHYAVISHGENGIGGYSAQGVLMQACPAASGTAPKEQRNCSYTGRYYDNTETSRAPGQNYNDDMMFYVDSVPSRIWIEATNDIDIVTGVQNIGIGTNTPIQDPAVKLNVMGNVRASVAAYADALCSSAPAASPPAAPTECHSPQVIGGIGMGCWTGDATMVPPPPAGVMTGIAGAKDFTNAFNYYDGAKCRQRYAVGVISASPPCPLGQAATGINASGGIVCGAM